MLHEPGAPYELNADELPEGRTLAPAAGEEESLRAQLTAWWRAGSWRTPLALFVTTLVLYGALAFDRLGRPSPDTHFVYLANTYNAMIAANFDDEVAARRADKLPFELDRDPPHRNDWASYWELTLTDGERVRGIWLDQRARRFERLDGKQMILERAAIDHRQSRQRYYISFPPAPAVLMMPLAAIQGYAVNDVLWTLFFAALNVALMFVSLEQLSRGGRSGRSRRENLWLTALFALGTTHLWCSVLGQVWFTALVMGVTFTLLYAMCAIDARRPLLAGVFCALAFSTRTPLLFTALLFYLFVLFPGGELLARARWREALRKIALFSAPCLVVGLSLMAMNRVRFESWTEFGHTYLAAGQLARIKQYGLFHYHFLSKNLTAMLTLLPRLQSSYPYVIISKHGVSLLLTTPAFIWLLRPRARTSPADVFWHRTLWLTVAACALPGLFYQNTGYEQFGYRFSLDYTPYLIMLLAIGRQPISRAFKACVLAAVAINTFGAVTFKRFYQFYGNHFFP